LYLSKLGNAINHHSKALMIKNAIDLLCTHDGVSVATHPKEWLIPILEAENLDVLPEVQSDPWDTP
jgi:hypothetical protein